MPKFPFLVSAEWLIHQLENPQVVVIDCRFRLDQPTWGQEQYAFSHIPGTYYFDLDRDLSSSVQRHGGRHPLPDVDILSQKLSHCGVVFGETQVIIYDDARFAFASRLWWLLRYLGHESVALLDGGWNHWKAAQYPVSHEIPSDRPGNFHGQPQGDWIVDLEQINTWKQEDKLLLIDARDRDRYLGLREPIDPLAGHIPGAINVPWQSVTNEQGFVLPISQQQKQWQEIGDAPKWVVYCGSGVTACVNLWSLALVGRTDAKLYPGGWSDWCSYQVEA